MPYNALCDIVVRDNGGKYLHNTGKKKPLLLEIRTTLAKDISSRINNQLGLMVTGFTLGPQLIPEPQLLLPN